VSRTQIVIAVVAALLVGGLVARVAAEGSRAGATTTAHADAAADAAADGATASDAGPGPVLMLGDGSIDLLRDGGALLVPDIRSDLPGFDDGGVLSDKAPKSVRFGVVLVQWAGAQGAPANARSQREALALANDLAEEAKKDFPATVKKGDSGSTGDAGRMHKGILEPGPERVLFSLPVGEVGGPVETPRGYWIVKRLE
jgi:hypothetical protein